MSVNQCDSDNVGELTHNQNGLKFYPFMLIKQKHDMYKTPRKKLVEGILLLFDKAGVE